jgi:hypothetical protein
MSEDRWQDTLETEELRDNPVLANFKTPEAAYQGLVELKAYQGRSIAIPGEDATAEAWADFDAKLTGKVPGVVRMPNDADEEDVKRFWGSLGVPEDKTEYTPPDDFEGLDDAVLKELVDLSETVGHTKDQHQKMLGVWAEAAAKMEEAAQQQRADDEAALKKTWGAAYEDNIAITDTILEKFGGKGDAIDLSRAERVLLLNIANSLTSDPQVFNQINNPTARKTPAELRADLDELRNSDIFANRQKYSREQYKGAVQKLTKLHAELAEYT